MTMPRIAAVVIGRNEGERLIACLASLQRQVSQLIYVDSGSTDGSVAAANAAGADVVRLDPARPFTAARGRNAGLAALGVEWVHDYVQFVDGDCAIVQGWLQAAAAFLDAHPQAVVVSGRLRERFPEASVYNRLCDREWNTPIGQAKACGGNAMMRIRAVQAVGGFREDLIAGEEPELCVRLRTAGGEIWRIDAEMMLHDAAITQFSQWWRRARRCGHAFAEGAALHGTRPERHYVSETRRALLWGLGVPVTALTLGVVLSPLALALLFAWPTQIVRLAIREGPEQRSSWEWAAFVTLGKVPEALGVLQYALNSLIGRRSNLIEYKAS